MALEIERRFLIDLPLAWYAKFKLNKCQIIRIYQTYLKETIPGLGNSHSRVRRSEYKLNSKCAEIKYFYTYKNTISPGVNEEVEFQIDKKEYLDRLENIDFNKRQIVKDRYVVMFNGTKVELDIFQKELDGLAVMEIELQNIDDKIILPPYFEVICEITSHKEYSNYQLASIDSLGLWKLATIINGV